MRWKADRVINGLGNNNCPCDIQPCVYIHKNTFFFSLFKTAPTLTLCHESGHLPIAILYTHIHTLCQGIVGDLINSHYSCGMFNVSAGLIPPRVRLLLGCLVKNCREYRFS